MIRLEEVQVKDKDLLWNINQKYLYEMTNFYDDLMDENGNFHYGHFEDYFTNPTRMAYFIRNDDTLVGFAMLCPYSNIGQEPDYTMAEFTIFPAYRRRHLALDTVRMILEKHPGKWEIKYNENNEGARKLWNAVATPFEPEVHHLNDEETVLAFAVRNESELNIELQDTEWPFEYTDHDRRIARAIVFDEEGHFYFVRAKRDDDFGKSTLIETSGGGVENGEDLRTAIKRELREELGAEVEVICKIGVVSDYYNLIHRHNLNNYFLCKVKSFGDKNLTRDEIEDFHLSTLKLTYEEAIREYERRRNTKLGRLIANRELPVLLRAKEMIEGEDFETMKLKIALLQLLPGKGLEEQLNIGKKACIKAKDMGADIALFPEMWSDGYRLPQEEGAVDKLAISVDSEFISAFRNLAKELQMAIGVTFLEKNDPKPLNSILLFDRYGDERLHYSKVHTCAFDDERVLAPGDDFYVAKLDIGSGTVRIGSMICFDREFPESARILMLKGAEVILAPNACPMEINRLSALRTRAYENMVAIATCNYPKGQPDCNGHSTVFDGVAWLREEPGVRDMCIFEAPKEEGIYLAEIDMDMLRNYREHEVMGEKYRHPDQYRILVNGDK